MRCGYLQCHELIGMDGDGVERIRRQAFEAGDRLDRAVKVAEAALAYAKYRADADCGAVDQMSFEHWRLWNRFIESLAKAKAANQS